MEGISKGANMTMQKGAPKKMAGTAYREAEG